MQSALRNTLGVTSFAIFSFCLFSFFFLWFQVGKSEPNITNLYSMAAARVGHLNCCSDLYSIDVVLLPLLCPPLFCFFLPDAAMYLGPRPVEPMSTAVVLCKSSRARPSTGLPRSLSSISMASLPLARRIFPLKTLPGAAPGDSSAIAELCGKSS